jgi:hypothetical protein
LAQVVLIWDPSIISPSFIGLSFRFFWAKLGMHSMTRCKKKEIEKKKKKKKKKKKTQHSTLHHGKSTAILSGKSCNLVQAGPQVLLD